MKSKYQDALNSLNPNYIGEQEYSWRKATEILQELVDKETPKKVKIMETVISKRYVFYDYECVNCGYEVSAMNDNYCSHCGQRITLEDSDENE